MICHYKTYLPGDNDRNCLRRPADRLFPARICAVWLGSLRVRRGRPSSRGRADLLRRRRQDHGDRDGNGHRNARSACPVHGRSDQRRVRVRPRWPRPMPATRRVTRALKTGGVRAADIQTSGLSISPNYRGNSQVPVGYGVSEQLTATLRNLAKAGSQIQAAVHGGRQRDHGRRGVAEPDRHERPAGRGQDQRGPRRAGQGSPVRPRAAPAAGRRDQHLRPVVRQTPLPEFAAVRARPGPQPPSVPVSPGKQQVSVQITVVYAIG